MGQMTIGILYGIAARDLAPTDASVEALEDLLYRFHGATGRSTTARGGLQVASTGQHALLGRWIAVGGSGEAWAAHFITTAVRLDDLPTLYADYITHAKTLWEEFAAYCSAHEPVALPTPTLWITPTEVA
jgi:hypothetical protein